MEYSSTIFLALALLVMICHVHSAPNSRRSRAAAFAEETTKRQSKLEDDFKEEITTLPPAPSNRKNKALNLFGYFPSFLSSGLDYAEDDDDDVTFAVNDDNFDEEDLSRTLPSRRRQQTKKKNGGSFANDNINSLQYDNSPIFYIRLPPTPYMFVPGLGYVSQPPSIGPPMPPMLPPAADPFINLPLDFVSNGKPTGVYQWNGGAGYQQVPQMPPVDFGYGGPQPMMPSPPRPNYNAPSYSKPKPKPAPSNSKVTNLKGTYVFNGKPNDSVYVLRDTYNSIYSDALQNFYP
ncbi:WW domain-binding protein 11 [Plodia interpunctella]|uniref:WW domain-binding protein 11 n=1 Tax=Plodia interpunctella TaxID=58824 RepID=UPI0023677064|nr:WW domain-binding protein 11 [Plodia interpunctella]XP_053607696.1 WW domain-binding protein 11 [Plodia interpunctella]XP_053607697.1 WW domain-binding protein 11 [Plodia interpunctella]XP_053607698.1 WW domain-binding protein 11 [Plodia interpunctella]